MPQYPKYLFISFCPTIPLSLKLSVRPMDRGKPPPLIYLYSDIECAAISERWISLIPVKER